jgi:SsrA-binding protein
MTPPESDRIKIITVNRKARYDYSIIETYEAGIVLKGTEVKSLRDGRANLKDSYVRMIDNEAWLISAHISPYSKGNIMNHDPRRDRKLLLHRTEINRLRGKLEQQGLALVPLRMYFKRGRAKAELALAKGKRLYDKREDLKRRVMDRETEIAMKGT